LKIIGLTGGIGSGKSTVARFLAERGAVVLDLDKAGHEALKPEGMAWQSVVAAFGKGILAPDGEIDRGRLAEIVFKDRRALRRLNRIIHPVIDGIVEKKIEDYRRRGVKVVVLEAAAMLESGKKAQAEELWVTLAPERVTLRRILARGGLSKQEARARIKSQLSNGERVKQADIVIDTDCTLEELKARVKEEWERLQERI
jgi:dephospho-CoA kinase